MAQIARSGDKVISIDVIEGLSSLQAISTEWDALVPEGYTAVFARSPWFFAWLDTFPIRRILATTARVQGELVGILPLVRFRTDARGLFFSQVAPAARGDYVAPVVRPDLLQSTLPLMLDAARSAFGDGSVFWWPFIPETDPAFEVMRRYFTSRDLPVAEEHEVAPRLAIDGRDFETLEKAWSPSHRTDVRRQRKRLAARGPLSIWEPATIADALAVLDEFFVVHDEKWLAQGFPGRFRDPQQRDHFRAIVRHMFGKGLHFSTLRCGEINCSYGFGFVSGGWIQWYRPSFRMDYQNYSPSKVHVALLVEEACRRGLMGMDFLLGKEPYKLLWSNDAVRVTSLLAGPSRYSPAYQWFARGKPFFREKVGPSLMSIEAWLQKLANRGPIRT
jgi:CelD/BcsL family acetyltransferase involved in cellulose biosynthesis